MKKQSFIVLLGICIGICLMMKTNATPFSDDDIITKSFVVKTFNGISVSKGIEVHLIIDGTESVVAECDEEYMDNVKISVTNEVLNITYKGRNSGYNTSENGHNEGDYSGDIIVIVHAKNIDNIQANTAGSVRWDDSINTDRIAIECTSAGSIKGNFKGDEINVELNSAGSYKGTIQTERASFSLSSASFARVKGNVTKLLVDASSVGVFKGEGLVYSHATTQVSSQASIYLSKSGVVIDKTSNPTGVFINSNSDEENN